MSNSYNSVPIRPEYFFPNKCLYYNMLLSQCFKNNPSKSEKNNNCGEILEKMEKFGCFLEFNSQSKVPFHNTHLLTQM